MSTRTYELTGLTCGHCVKAVTEEVGALDGVTDVQVELVAGGTSTMTIEAQPAPGPEALSAALDEAGDYSLVRSAD